MLRGSPVCFRNVFHPGRSGRRCCQAPPHDSGVSRGWRACQGGSQGRLLMGTPLLVQDVLVSCWGAVAEAVQDRFSDRSCGFQVPAARTKRAANDGLRRDEPRGSWFRLRPRTSRKSSLIPTPASQVAAPARRRRGRRLRSRPGQGCRLDAPAQEVAVWSRRDTRIRRWS